MVSGNCSWSLALGGSREWVYRSMKHRQSMSSCRDNLWPIVTSLILAPVVNEFGFAGPWLKLGQGIGLLVGAVFWGVASDVWGRRCVDLWRVTG